MNISIDLENFVFPPSPNENTSVSPTANPISREKEFGMLIQSLQSQIEFENSLLQEAKHKRDKSKIEELNNKIKKLKHDLTILESNKTNPLVPVPK